MKSVKLHPEAFAELEAAFRWYEEKTPGLGAEFLDEVDKAIASIHERPATWPVFDPSSGIRRFLLHRFPFGVLYHDATSLIHIVAIMHLRRKPGYWRTRR